MSSDFRGLVPATGDPMLQLVVTLMKRQAKFLTQQQVDLVDSDNEDIFTDGQDMETAIKYHSELSTTHKFLFIKDYYPPFEPDGNQVKIWLRGQNTGNTTKDWSTFGHTATIYGDPTLVDGTIDLGIHDGGAVKSIARRMNRPTSDYENLEWLQIADHADIQVATVTTGLSIFVRFRMKAIADQNGIAATIFEKIDDSTPNNAYMLQVLSDGRLLFVIKDGGTTTAKYAAVGSIVTDTVYDVFLTYTVSGSVLHIYIDGVDKSLSSFVGTVNWQDITTNHDLYLFKRGMNSEERGCVYGDFYDFKYYKDRVVNQTEVTQHYTNKWTIADIDFGHVMITNEWATFTGSGGEETPSDTSFTVGAFTVTSFTVV